MDVGYARTSTLDQIAGLEAQVRDLKAAGCEQVYQEQASALGARLQLEAALSFLRRGDTLVVTKIDRLARNTRVLGEIVDGLHARGIALKVLQFGKETVDTRGAYGKLVLNMFSAFAEFERDLMRERQMEGIAKAKREGKYKGRKPTARAKAEDAVALFKQGKTVTEIAKLTGIGRGSVYRALQAAGLHFGSGDFRKSVKVRTDTSRIKVSCSFDSDAPTTVEKEIGKFRLAKQKSLAWRKSMPRSGTLQLTDELVARAHRVVPSLPLPDYLAPRTEADHEADVAAILADRPPGDDFWLFAYGSLLWNPAVNHIDEAPALAHGWHRAFCMIIRSYRGTPDRPGLMMALDRGGQCQGVVLKLPSSDLEHELHRLVRREMPYKRADGVPVHAARWIRARVGSRSISALAYVINHRGPSYAGRLQTSEVADILASSCGPAGSCAEYLYQTVVQLDRRGIRDNKLWHLQALVAERLERRSDPTE